MAITSAEVGVRHAARVEPNPLGKDTSWSGLRTADGSCSIPLSPPCSSARGQLSRR